MNGSTLKLRTLVIASMLGLGVSLAACEKKEESPIEKVTESVKDGLDMRENEKMKDAGENAADAFKDAGEAIEEKAEEATE